MYYFEGTGKRNSFIFHVNSKESSKRQLTLSWRGEVNEVNRLTLWRGEVNEVNRLTLWRGEVNEVNLCVAKSTKLTPFCGCKNTPLFQHIKPLFLIFDTITEL